MHVRWMGLELPFLPVGDHQIVPTEQMLWAVTLGTEESGKKNFDSSLKWPYLVGEVEYTLEKMTVRWKDSTE